MGKFGRSRNSFVLLPALGAHGKTSTDAVICHLFQVTVLWPISLPVPRHQEVRRDTFNKFPITALFFRSLCLLVHTNALPADSCIPLSACFSRCHRYHCDICIGTSRVPLRKSAWLLGFWYKKFCKKSEGNSNASPLAAWALAPCESQAQ